MVKRLRIEKGGYVMWEGTIARRSYEDPEFSERELLSSLIAHYAIVDNGNKKEGNEITTGPSYVLTQMNQEYWSVHTTRLEEQPDYVFQWGRIVAKEYP